MNLKNFKQLDFGRKMDNNFQIMTSDEHRRPEPVARSNSFRWSAQIITEKSTFTKYIHIQDFIYSGFGQDYAFWTFYWRFLEIEMESSNLPTDGTRDGHSKLSICTR